MRPERHEIPTHLDVEDKAFYGLSVRQATYLSVGLSLGYGLWSQQPGLALALRLALAVACVAAGVVLTFVRPSGRALEEWLFVALHYAATPKLAVWRPREPETDITKDPGMGWEELSPRLGWRKEEDR